MNAEKLQKMLETVAEELITSDIYNLSDLGKIYDCFQKIRDEAKIITFEKLANGAQGAADLIKKMMLDETIDRDKMFHVLSNSITTMQQIIQSGSDNVQFTSPDLQLSAVTNEQIISNKYYTLPGHIDNDIFNDFINDQDSVLEKLESHLLSLEHGNNKDTIADLRRIFHTLKGEAGIFELFDIEKLCHMTEDLMDSSGDTIPIDSLFIIKDWLKNIFDALKNKNELPNLDEKLLSLMSVKSASEEKQSNTNGPRQNKIFSLPEIIDEEIFNGFLNEQDSVLEKMESHILALEHMQDKDVLDDLRRIFHTLKGEAAVFELDDIVRLCHVSEDIINSSSEHLPIDKLLTIKDFLKEVFDALKNKNCIPELDSSLQSIIRTELKKSSVDNTPEINLKKQTQAVPKENAVIYNHKVESFISTDIDLLSDFVSEVQEHIDTIDNKLLSLENNPQDVDLLNAVFRVFHTIKGAAGFLGLNEIAKLSHTTENLLDLARKGEITLSGGKIDVIFDAVDEMKKLVRNIGTAISSGSLSYVTDSTLDNLLNKIQKTTLGKSSNTLPETTRLADTVSSGDQSSQNVYMHKQSIESKAAGITTDSFQTVTSDVFREAQNNLYDAVLNIEDRAVTPSQEILTSSGIQQTKGKIKESIKVDSENLDKLIDAIGELVIIESMICQDTDLKSSASSMLLRNITQMDKITRELQQLGMSLRMIPVKATFQKMARVVRDLAKKGNKKIDFISHGEDTMLDKSVVDRIGDPLIHLVRNSVDHGIEANPELRTKSGKIETGRIELTAFHKGGNIYIEIKDDGRGLNKNAIIEKAKEKGLMRESHSLSDREIFNFIFLPGFSTAQKVTDVSGRGVGMDVVKRTIEDLRGNIDILSEPGKGTTFSLRLPLTLAIIDGMLVRIGVERYIIPTLSIVEAIRPKKGDISTIVHRGEMIKIRDKLIPLFRLAQLFTIDGSQLDPTEGIVIVVEDSGNMTGILVDELLGQQSTVIKSLGAYMKGLPGISGGSIMSDGRVGIIVDIAGIVKLATSAQDV